MTPTTLQLSKPYGTLTHQEAGVGTPVVLIHGVGMQSAAWQPQIKALSKTHRVIAIDMPGHGGSSPLPEGAQLPEFVEWLNAVLTELQLESVSLAGHSMGALIAAGYVATYPDAIDRVALLNGVFRRSPEARAEVKARAEQTQKGEIDFEAPLARWFGDDQIEQTILNDVARWLSEVDRGGYATAYGAFASGDETYADRIEHILCPLLALTGDGDLNSTPAMSRAIAEAAPRGRALIIEGHRHMVNLTAPDAVNAALLDWLNTGTGGD